MIGAIRSSAGGNSGSISRSGISVASRPTIAATRARRSARTASRPLTPARLRTTDTASAKPVDNTTPTAPASASPRPTVRSWFANNATAPAAITPNTLRRSQP